MPNFTVSLLSGAQIREAWPLIRMAAPEVPLERWEDYARSLLERGGGLLGLFAGDATLHGAATFLPEDDLRHGRALRVDNIVTFELNRSAPARRVMCEALDLIAEGFGCAAVILTMGSRGYADPASPKAEGWHRLGLELDAVLFAKTLARGRVESAA